MGCLVGPVLRVRALAPVLVALAALPLAACGGDDEEPPAPPASSPAAAPTTAAPLLSPLTGAKVDALGPVLAVKVDNVRPARPPVGLRQADVVYVEPVEGGLSRLLAVFSSTLPDRVGPVRSARESDIELLAQYGKPAFAFSGANRKVLPLIAKAPVADVSADKAGGAYRRDRSRSAPHNLFASPEQLVKRGKGVTDAKDVGFRFGAAPAGGAPATAPVKVSYAAATTTFTWSAAAKRFMVSMDGRPEVSDGKQAGASTVVVQYTKIEASKLKDKLGNATPYTDSVGSGTALVLRDGQKFEARWSRPSDAAGTTFTTAAGAPLTFAPGQVWVVFAKSG